MTDTGAVFTIPAGVLHSASEWASRACPSKASTPILQGLLIDAGGDALSITGFDFDRRATVTVEAFVEHPGSLVLPGRLLTAVTAATAPKTDMRVDMRKAKDNVTADRARWTVPSLPVDEYPQLPVPGDVVGSVDAELFCAAAKKVLPAVSRLPQPVNLTGVRFEASGSELVLVATDAYRLSCCTIPWDGDDMEGLIPASTLEIATRVVTAGRLNIHVGNGNLFGVSSPTHLLVGPQLAEQYAPWRKIIPTDQSWWSTFLSEDLDRALKQVAPAMEKATVVALTADTDSITLKATSSDGGAEVTFDADHEGDPITIGFAPEYLKTALDTLRSEKVTASFTGVTRPVRLVGDDPQGHAHIVMPKRLS